MLFYIAFIAIVNLLLGYALAVYLGATRRAIIVAAPAPRTIDRYETESSPSEATDAYHDREAYESAAPEPESTSHIQEPPLIDPITGLKTRSHFQQLLRWRATAADASETHLTVALLEVDLPSQLDQSTDDRLLRGVAGSVRELLTDSQTAVRYSDHQILLLLDNDQFDKATERAEQVRQRIETTDYVADGKSLHATVTCALLETTAAEPEARLLEQLQQALEEARRYGGNCTFKHDGTAVAPVVPLEVSVEPQKCSI
jgi:diguanylate cyclase (GGDEF)-like protein